MGKTLPPLSALAAFFAAIDLIAVRIVLRGTEGGVLWDALGPYAKVPLTVAAIAACVALTTSLVGILRMPPPPAFSHRLSLALFTGVFVPVVVAATFMPRTVIVRDSNFLVHLATFSAGLLVVLFAAVAIPRPGPSSLRIGAFLLSITSFTHVFHLSTTSMGLLSRVPLFAQLGALAEIVGLACYCLVPGVVAIAAIRGAIQRQQWLALAAGAAIGLLATAVLTWQIHMDPRVELSVTAGLGFHLLASLWRLTPALMVGLFCAVATCLLIARRPQAGLALLLILSAGFSPTAPGYLIMWVLGTALLMRASISVDYVQTASVSAAGRRPPSNGPSEHHADDAGGHASGEHSAEHGAQA